jgi:hypothetical protein
MRADDSLDASDLEVGVEHRLTLDFDPFTWEALMEESTQLGVSIHELVGFSVRYYLADHDSGRIARRMPKPLSPGEPNPLGKLLRG